MADAITTATAISRNWPQIGAIPKPLQAAIEAFDECQYAQPPAPPNPADATPTNVAETVEAYALALAVADKHVEALRQVRTTLAVRVIQIADAEVPAMIGKLQTRFDTAVQQYLDAVKELPESLDSDTLLAAGSEVQAAFKTATTAAADIRAIDTWLAGTADLPSHVAYERYSVLRTVKATTRDELTQLLDAKPANPNEDKLGAVYLVAAKLGLHWRMATAGEAAACKAEIDALPVVKQRRFVSW